MKELRLIRAGIAAIWLTTGLGVLHPHFREVGAHYLDLLHLPHWLMSAACVGEVALGCAVLLAPVMVWLEVLQAAAVVGFTVVLAAVEPMLLVHPFGVLSKNYPLLVMLLVSVWVSREGWSARATWLLRFGMALVWVTEGLLPKVFFQQPMELAVVAGSGLVQMDPSVFLRWLGLAQALSGLLVFVLKGRLVQLLLAGQVLALAVLPLLVSWQDPLLWVHPFGPMTKNLPLIAGTVVALRRVRAA